MPPGVVNILSGFGPTAGEALICHPDVEKVSFTGSTAVGKRILQASGETNLKKVSLELGGKSPSIVYPDANEDWVVDGIMLAMRFTRQSQSCTAGSRMLCKKCFQFAHTFHVDRGKRLVQ